MPRVTWPLQGNRPVVQVQVVDAASGDMVTCSLLADTGAGGLDAPFELILRVSAYERYMELWSSDSGAGRPCGGLSITPSMVLSDRVQRQTFEPCRRSAVRDTFHHRLLESHSSR